MCLATRLDDAFVVQLEVGFCIALEFFNFDSAIFIKQRFPIKLAQVLPFRDFCMSLHLVLEHVQNRDAAIEELVAKLLCLYCPLLHS